MTTEEKAKAYDEALERARRIHEEILNSELIGFPEQIREIFPELRESEDEEIRKDIIGGLMWQRDNLKSEGPHDNNLILPGFCLTVGEHLKYLEKQKEQKSAEIDFEDWDMLDYIRNILRKRVRKDEEFNVLDKWLTEHYVIQKPTWNEEGERIYNIIIEILEKAEHNGRLSHTNLIECVKMLKSLRLQSKPGWSKEDEKMLEDTIERLTEAYYEDVIGDNIKWLKSLRPTKQEWSEGDEKMREKLINLLGSSLVPLTYKEWSDYCFWLKSLRPSWKPSEEQMEALRIAAYEPHKNWNEKLQELYEQLKKL